MMLSTASAPASYRCERFEDQTGCDFGPGDEGDVLVLRREHAAGVEAQAETCRVRAGQGDRRFEVAALMAPAEFRIWQIALYLRARNRCPFCRRGRQFCGILIRVLVVIDGFA